jgi:hypothetical protein
VIQIAAPIEDYLLDPLGHSLLRYRFTNLIAMDEAETSVLPFWSSMTCA